MRFCLVSYNAPYAIPYINLYLNQIEAAGADCDILYWDRECSDATRKEGHIRYLPYSGKAPQNSGKFARYIHYVPATKHIRNYLSVENYDRVVFLQTHAAVACKNILEKNYSGRYIVDIRDYTLENIKPFFKSETQVIKNSYCTIISSEGYKQFLPVHDYVVAHNFTPVDSATVNQIRGRAVKKKGVNLSFIGNVRFYDVAKKILLSLKNDERFRISYIGTGAEALNKFCIENQVQNACLKGRFSPDETVKHYRDCDIVNNFYGNHNRYLDYALSNKLYYAAQFNIPVLVSRDTYSSQIAKKHCLGFSWDIDAPDAADELYKAYMDFDRTRSAVQSRKFLQAVENDNAKFEQVLSKFMGIPKITDSHFLGV